MLLTLPLNSFALAATLFIIVIIDFLIRHSFITADTEADYLDILYHLHRRLEFPGPRKTL